MSKKRIIKTLFVFLFSLIFCTFVSGQVFYTSLDVCDTDWQCTNYTQDTCGERLCLDANFCGVQRHKPIEHIDCPVNETNTTTIVIISGGGSGGGGFFAVESTTSTSFSISNDILRVGMLQDETLSRAITINSDLTSEYILSIIDESGLGAGQKVLALSSYNFTLEDGKSKRITLLFDTSGIDEGTYVFLVNVSNNDSENKITIILDVSSNNKLLDFVIEVPTKNKIIDDSSIINLDIIFPNWLKETVTIDYYLIESDGNRILLKTESVIANESITKNLEIPKNLKPGLYTLSVTLKTLTESKSKSELFWVQPDTTFYSLEEEPNFITENKSINEYFIYALIFIFVMILLTMSFTLSRGPFPGTKNTNKFVVATNPVVKTEVKYLDEEDKNKALKDAYAQGLITKQQFNKFSKEKSFKKNKSKRIKTKIVYVEKKLPSRLKEHKLFLPQGVLRANVHGEDAIFLREGIIICSLEDLMEFVRNITQEEFNHHTKEGKNDFFIWVKEKFKQPELAQRLKDAKTIQELNKAFYK